MAEIQYVTQKQNTYVWDPESGEKNSGEIMTIQGETYTIKELLEKFVKNSYPKGIERFGLYNDAPDLDEVDIMSKPDRDFTDAKEFIDKTRDKLGKLRAAKGKKDKLKKEPIKAKSSEAERGDEKADLE